jgi:hypothetical protein
MKLVINVHQKGINSNPFTFNREPFTVRYPQNNKPKPRSPLTVNRLPKNE